MKRADTNRKPATTNVTKQKPDAATNTIADTSRSSIVYHAHKKYATNQDPEVPANKISDKHHHTADNKSNGTHYVEDNQANITHSAVDDQLIITYSAVDDSTNVTLPTAYRQETVTHKNKGSPGANTKPKSHMHTYDKTTTTCCKVYLGADANVHKFKIVRRR